MCETRNLQQRWTEDELVVVLDMYLNGGLRDSHGFDDIARFLGRYSPNTTSFHDGAINEKLAEIIGILEPPARGPRHPGSTLEGLVGRYNADHAALRARAVAVCRGIAAVYRGRLPGYIVGLLRDETSK